MTDVLSVGFINHAVNTAPLSEVHQQQLTLGTQGLWLSPNFQVIDIQRFSGEEGTPARYYLALSDSTTLMWAVVPPSTAVEEAINDFELEPGSSLTLDDYSIVEAANGLRVLVVHAATVHSVKLSLIGNLTYDPELFTLSRKAIQKIGGSGLGSRTQGDPITQLTLKQLWADHAELGGINWGVTVMLLWKGKLRRVMAGGEDGSTARGKFVFDARVMDREGTTTNVVFWGSQRHHRTVDVNDVIVLSLCYLKFDQGDPPQPIAIQVSDRSIIDLLPNQQVARDEFPENPVEDLGGMYTSFVDLGDIRQEEIGAVVSVRAVVVKRGAVVATVTRRGNVNRRSLTLRDCEDPLLSMDITLWDELANETDPGVGEIWCFRDVVIRMFGNAKVLSSRSSSEVFLAPRDAPIVHRNQASVQAQNATAHQGGGVHQQAPQLPNVVFDLTKANHSLTPFCAVRIVHVRTPLLYKACTHCAKKMGANGCPQCGPSAESELRFLVRLLLSDGIEATWATGFTTVGEALFGLSTSDFIAQGTQDPEFVPHMARCLVGVPILAKLAGVSVGQAEQATSDAHIIEVQHVDIIDHSSLMVQQLKEYGVAVGV